MARTPQLEDTMEAILDELRDTLKEMAKAAIEVGAREEVILLALHWQAASLCLEAGIDPAALTSAIRAVRDMLGGEAGSSAQAGQES